MAVCNRSCFHCDVSSLKLLLFWGCRLKCPTSLIERMSFMGFDGILENLAKKSSWKRLCWHHKQWPTSPMKHVLVQVFSVRQRWIFRCRWKCSWRPFVRTFCRPVYAPNNLWLVEDSTRSSRPNTRTMESFYNFLAQAVSLSSMAFQHQLLLRTMMAESKGLSKRGRELFAQLGVLLPTTSYRRKSSAPSPDARDWSSCFVCLFEWRM